MENKAKNQAVLSLLKTVFILLIAIAVVFSQFADADNLVALIIGRTIFGLLCLNEILYVVFLVRGRTGKGKLVPIFLALGMVVGFAIPIVALTISYEAELVGQPLLLSFIGIIMGIVCMVLLFKASNKPTNDIPVLYDEQYALQYMKNRATRERPLSALIDIFEAMCQIPLQNEVDKMLLFEPGAQNADEYLIHLVRQTSAPDEEYYQITMDIVFPLDDVVGKIESTKWMPVWSFEINDDFFDYIKNSIQYRLLRDREPISVEMSVDRT